MSRARDLANVADDVSTGTVVTTASPSLGRRNLIINGAMQVAQRGTDLNNVTSTSYTADRWKLFKIDADQLALDYDNVSDAPDGFSNSLKITVATAETAVDASEWNMVNQPIEGQNLQQVKSGLSSAQDLTLSFWVKSSVTGTYTVSVYCPDFSSSPNRKYYGVNYTIDTANTWEYKTVTISGNTNSGDTIANDNSEGMRLGFMLGAGTNFTSGSNDTWGGADGWAAGINNSFVTTLNATWQITGVQLEVGPLATPFEHHSYGEQLALCQRYYEKSYSYATVPGTSSTDAGRVLFMFGNSTSGYVGGYATFTVTKRANPTVTTYAPNAGTSGQGSYYVFGSSTTNATLGTSNVSDRGFSVYNTGYTADAVAVHFSADAEL